MQDDFSDLGGVPVQAPQPPATPPVGNPVPASADDYSDLGGVPLSSHAQTLAQDPNFDPVEHYRSNQSKQALIEAREAFKQRAAQPTNAGQAAWDATKGFVTGIPSAVASMAKGAGGAIANLATEVNPMASQADQERAQRENAAALQMGALHGKDFATGLARNAHRLFGKYDSTLSDAEIEQRIQNDAAQRQVEGELSQGQVIDAPGFSNVANNQSPEQLAAQGSPIRPERIENESFIGDPTTFAMEGAGKLSGPAVSKFITAPILKGAGKAVGAIGRAGARVGEGPAAVAATALGAFHGVIPGALMFSAELAAKHLAPAASQLLGEAGAEAAGTAAPVGQSLLRKATKGAVTGAVTGTAIGAPFAAAAQTPEQAGQAFGGGLGIGAALGAYGGVRHASDTERAAKASQMMQEGENIRYGLGWEDDANAQDSQNLAPVVRNQLNILRSHLNGMTDANGIPIQAYALSGDNYARSLAEAGSPGATDTNGFVTPDKTKIIINADKANGATLGHETGHIVEFLQGIQKSADIDALQKSIQSAMYNEDGTPIPIVQKFIERYKQALIANGEDPAQANARGNDYYEKEFLAEHAAKILAGQPISDFHLPKPIADRITQGASRWLEGKGIIPKTSGKIGFGADEIKDITRQMSDILYKQGQKSEALRTQRAAGQEEPPSVARERMRLENSLRDTPNESWSVDKLNQYDRDRKDLAALNAKFTGPTGQPIQTTPTQVGQGIGPVVGRDPLAAEKADAVKAMGQLGVSAKDAAQHVEAAAQAGATTSGDLLTQAMRISRGLPPITIERSPNVAPAQPEPKQSTQEAAISRRIESAKTQTEKDAATLELERVQQAKNNPEVKTNEPAPVSTLPVVPEKNPAVATVGEPLPQPSQKPAPTREALQTVGKQSADAAEEATKASPEYQRKRGNPKAGKSKEQAQQDLVNEERDKASLEAMAKSHSETLPDDSDLVRMQTDRFGRTSIRGTRIDPEDPFHQELLERAGYGPQEKAKLRTFQRSLDKPVSVEYLSAPDDPKAQSELDKLGPREQVKYLRQQAQKESSASERAEGTAPVRRAAKSFIPQAITFHRGSNSFTVDGFSPDKFFSNARKVLPWLIKKGLETYSGADDPRLVSDFNGYARNHENGWRGDGSAPIQGTPLTSANATEGYEPHVIPKDRFDTLNALLGDESATRVSDEGKERGGTPENKMARAEKQVLAKSNSPYLNPETGEVNRVRQMMKNDGDFTFTTDKGERVPRNKILEEASESIRPDLVENIGDAKDAKDAHKLRESGVDPNSIADITGTPRSNLASAGFQPDETTPKDRAQDRIRDRIRDRDYMAAAQSGDKETAQKLVDEAAKNAGYNIGPVYHAGNVKNVFMQKYAMDVGHHFGTKEVADRFGGARGFYLKGERLLRTKDGGDTASWAKSIADSLKDKNDGGEFDSAIDDLEGVYNHSDEFFDKAEESVPDNGEEEAWGEWSPRQQAVEDKARADIADSIRSILKPLPFDAIVYSNLAEDGGMSDSYMIFRGNKPSQIKSADPITRDDQGNIIPLGQRFNKAINDIRFQPSEDTGSPEHGGTPGERLAREAELAGVVLKPDDMKALMRNDQETMNRLRARIQTNTGKQARFQPDDPESGGGYGVKMVFENGKWTDKTKILSSLELKSILSEKKPLFFRLHSYEMNGRLADEFNSDNAFSSDIGANDEPQRGYSSFDNPKDLIHYWSGEEGPAYRSAEDDRKVVIFSGDKEKNGTDGELLVVPDGKSAHWTTLGDLKNSLNLKSGFQPDEKTLLFRASDNPESKAGAHFSENENDARAYQDNQGFGGKNLHKYKVDSSRVAEVLSLRDLANHLEPLLSETQHEWAEENGGLERAMRDNGYTHVFHALENSFGPRRNRIDPIELLKKDHDWIRFDDDFPEGAKTWRYIGKDTLVPIKAASFQPEEESRPFYSQLVEATKKIPQAMMTVGQARSAIEKGAKPDEVRMSGILTDPLSPMFGRDQNEKVSRDALQSYALERQAKVEDVTLGGIEKPEIRYDPELEMWRFWKNGKFHYGFDTKKEAQDFISEGLHEFADKRETHFDKYQLPGAEPGTYREQFVTWPQKKGTTQDEATAKLKVITDAAMKRGGFTSEELKEADRLSKIAQNVRGKEEWPSPENWEDGHSQYSSIANPVVRIRRNIRTDSNGNKTLFLEEIQGPNPDNQEKMPPELRKRIYEIGMKRAIREAADEGATHLGWTDGQTQTDRYSLEKQVASVHAGRLDSGPDAGKYVVSAKTPGGQSIAPQTLSEGELEDNVGKELAKKIIEDQKGDDYPEGKEYSGLDLKVGGEGLKNLYDTMLPRIAEKLTGKLGGKVTQSELPGQLAKSGNDILESANVTREQWNAMTAGERKAIKDKFSTGTKIHSLELPAQWQKQPPRFPLFQPNAGPSQAVKHANGPKRFIAAAQDRRKKRQLQTQ